MNIFEREIVDLLREVCFARRITIEEYCRRGRKKVLVSARRALAVIYQDRHWLKNDGKCVYHSWGDLSDITGVARSTYLDSVNAWVAFEGSENPGAEENARKRGYLPHKTHESIHEMAKRVCKKTDGVYFHNAPSSQL